MIRPLRQCHRVTVITLGIVLPVALLAGIAGRRAIPTQSLPIGEFAGQAVKDSRAIWERDDLWPGRAIHTGLFIQSTTSCPATVEISAKEPLLQAEVLVYWVPEGRKTEQDIPGDAQLLGVYSGSPALRLALPAEAARERGFLLLYSLANQATVARSHPFTTQSAHD